MQREDLRNIAIIAHVDHGKTTLVDEMLAQSGTFRENQQVAERILDSGDIERERGITILAKNAGLHYKDVKINIVDTPGHADFGGEVERVLKMVNGVLLLVDAAEGCMPQTRFVLQKALAQQLSLVIVVNKVDRPDARIKEVIDEILQLLMDLGATDEQFDAPMVFTSGREGTASYSPEEPGQDLRPLYETIIEYVKPPQGDPDAPLAMLASSIDYNDYVGRIGIGRVENGVIRQNMDVAIVDANDPSLQKKARVTALYSFEGVGRAQVEGARAGDIVAFSGLSDIQIGNTVTSVESPVALPFLKINEPTVEMTFSVNDSPFAGKEGNLLTSRQIGERLHKETLRDVALRVSDGETTESFCVMGRGEMHLAILIETMRREGFEFLVGAPRVLTKEENGTKMEPMEQLVIDVPSEYQGAVMQKIGQRQGELLQMVPLENRMRLEFLIPSRGLFGYRSEFLTDTHGEGVLNTISAGFAPWKGELPGRQGGSLVSYETGEAVTYGLYSAQQRGRLFVGPGEAVYAGMVVGLSPKNEDITVNVCKRKHQTNVRASGSDDALRLTPKSIMSLEDSLEFLAADELVEVTPKSIRIRKRVLNHEQRMKEAKKEEKDR
ncbi:translational GTPase TypA [Ruminococcaceae bacterium OttesenSCG-928-I18]|nr:translational GTPase TypA [Ruminococcaceae bacterium OttesenSCG-928-I18]